VAVLSQNLQTAQSADETIKKNLLNPRPPFFSRARPLESLPAVFFTRRFCGGVAADPFLPTNWEKNQK
jgi:hypothetical protein